MIVEPVLNRRFLYLSAAVIILSAFLRLYGLEHESLWNDELSSCFRSSYGSLEDVIFKGVVPDVHPPGYQIFLYFVENSIGSSPTALRLPSAAAGVLTVLLTILLGRVLFSDSIALLAGGFLAVSPMHIWLSQEGRPYSILILLCTAAVYLAFLLYKNADYKTSILLAADFILLEYLHYFGSLMYMLTSMTLLVLFIRRKHHLLKIAPAVLLPAIAYAPWIPYAITQSGSGSYIESPGLMNLLYLFFEYFGWSRVLPVLFFIAVFLAFLRFFRHSALLREYKNLPVPVLWLLLPLVSSFLISMFLVPVFTIRNMMVALPAVFLIFSSCIHVVFLRPVPRLLGAAALLLLMLYSLFFVRNYYSEPHRNQFREAAAYVAGNAVSDSSSLIVASAWNKAYFDYYFQRFNSSLLTDMVATGPDDFPALKELMRMRNPDEIWLLWGHVEPESALVDSISMYFHNTEYQPFLGAGVFHFSVKNGDFP